MPDRLWIRGDYRARSLPSYYEDEPAAIVRQPDVYADAALLADALRANTIVDVGCGNGAKLVEFAGPRRTIGIDIGANLERARRGHPDRAWREHDLAQDAPLPITAEEAREAVIVCSDVIEHLVDPAPLLRALRRLLDVAAAVVLSTPERELARGLDDRGPPANEAHMREWSLRELLALLRESGFDSLSVGLTRSDDHDHAPHTVLVVATSDPARTARCAAVLVDAPLRSRLPDRSALRWRVRRALRLLLIGR